MSRRWALASFFAAACSACLGEIDAPHDDASSEPKLEITSRWDGEGVLFVWELEGSFDAFNAIVSRDDLRAAQIELDGAARDLFVDAHGTAVVSIQLQACNKGLLRSTCTAWTSAEARR
jgi:hypothetical protein